MPEVSLAELCPTCGSHVTDDEIVVWDSPDILGEYWKVLRTCQFCHHRWSSDKRRLEQLQRLEPPPGRNPTDADLERFADELLTGDYVTFAEHNARRD